MEVKTKELYNVAQSLTWNCHPSNHQDNIAIFIADRISWHYDKVICLLDSDTI